MWYFGKISLAIFCALNLAMVPSSQAQNSPQDYLNTHNAARSAVGVGEMTWDNFVAEYAQNYANERSQDCALQHSTNGPYGENLAIGSGDFMTGKAAVDLWVGEEKNYDYDSNSCAGGEMCGHYTQVVWRDSVRLGCARVQCTSGSWFVTCNYDPPGNFNGQRPY
ncbi:pathogenesis-related protein PR-1 type-like [Cornus florida]|uniref:pathogenesis-related protein PR-1 type-like n=1 Tax=Cornus florida TaxID=4283 RepID=UPI00289FB198|nr:pathogenesis-related protein PR-1 type-like [Cornus florida]